MVVEIFCLAFTVLKLMGDGRKIGSKGHYEDFGHQLMCEVWYRYRQLFHIFTVGVSHRKCSRFKCASCITVPQYVRCKRRLGEV